MTRACSPDPAEVAAALALALLQRYQTDQSVDTLSTVIEHLHEAVTTNPDHPDWLGWCFWLGTAYAERADRCERPDDYDPAVAWVEKAYAGLPLDDPDHDGIALALADVNVDRFDAQQPADGHPSRVAVDDLVAMLDSLTVIDPEAAAHLDTLRGLAYLERHGLTEEAADLDRGIQHLDRAVPALPPDLPGRGAAEVALVNAYRMRAVRAGADDHASAEDRGTVTDDLTAAGRHAARALGSGGLNGDVALQLHHLSVTAGYLQLGDTAQGRPPVPVSADVPLQPPSASLATVLRQRVASAGEALVQIEDADPTVRAELAFTLVLAANRTVAQDVTLLDTYDTAQVREWLALASRHPDPHPAWPAAIDMLAGINNVAADAQRPAGTVAAADHFARARDGLRDLVGTDDLRDPLLMSLIAEAASTDERHGFSVASRLLGTRDELAASPDAESELWGLLMSAVIQHRQGHRTAFAEAAERVVALAQTASNRPEHTVTVLPLVRILQQVAGMPGAPPATWEVPPELAHTGHGLASALLMAAADVTQAETTGDLTTIRAGARRLAELADRATPEHAVRFLGATVTARAHLALARRDRTDHPAAEAAVRWYEEASRFAEHDEHPLWSEIAMGLAESLRLADARDLADGSRCGPHLARSRRLGLSALRGHAWRVLRQAVTDAAVGVARAASADAHTVAHWCLADDATGDLVAALELGRGLVLDATTVSRDIPARLQARGHPDLADQWRATAGLGYDRLTGEVVTETAPEQIPDDLRLRALRALRAPTTPAAAAGARPAGTSQADEAVRIVDIKAALTSLGADALVYLVPASAGPGTAVVVPVAGEVETLRLTGLEAGPGSPVSRYTASPQAARDADLSRPSPTGTSLDALCQWAWDTAVRHLVDRTRRWHLRRPARLVLVAMGALGLVPWHGAYTTVAGERRYALTDLVISYAVSARMLCHTASRPRREITSALVVGDPGGDLPYAGAEARAIRRCFYPDATYLGQPAAQACGAGTPEQVRGWIERAPGPSLLHLACHGHVDPHQPDTSYLLLADGRQLLARDLLEASRLSPLGTEMVFLAACSTNLSGEDFDEAFSLATTFLAAGAGTVFGSLWRVPDSSTSLLMFVLHHYLNTERLPPADALRQAQRWMLDRDRQPPHGMPAELIRHCRDDRAADPVSWAAFTHLGR